MRGENGKDSLMVCLTEYQINMVFKIIALIHAYKLNIVRGHAMWLLLGKRKKRKLIRY